MGTSESSSTTVTFDDNPGNGGSMTPDRRCMLALGCVISLSLRPCGAFMQYPAPHSTQLRATWHQASTPVSLLLCSHDLSARCLHHAYMSTAVSVTWRLITPRMRLSWTPLVPNTWVLVQGAALWTVDMVSLSARGVAVVEGWSGDARRLWYGNVCCSLLSCIIELYYLPAAYCHNALWYSSIDRHLYQ